MTQCNVVQYETELCYCTQCQGHCATMLLKKVHIVTMKLFPACRILPAARAASAAAAALLFALWRIAAHVRNSPGISAVVGNFFRACLLVRRLADARSGPSGRVDTQCRLGAARLRRH